MKKVIAAFALLLVMGAGCAGGAGGGAKSDIPADAQSSPEKVVTAFYAAMAAGDTAGARTLVKTEVQGTDAVEKFFTSFETYDFLGGEVKSTSGDWVNTSVRINWGGTEITGSSTVKVEEADGKWWIVELPST